MLDKLYIKRHAKVILFASAPSCLKLTVNAAMQLCAALADLKSDLQVIEIHILLHPATNPNTRCMLGTLLL